MSRKKRSKSKKTSNCVEEDLSGIIEVNSDNGEKEREWEKRSAEQSGPRAGSPSENPPPRKNKTSKEVYFALLPDKYEPLIEDAEEETEEERRLRKEKKMRRKEKHKKYRKVRKPWTQNRLFPMLKCPMAYVCFYRPQVVLNLF